jgi:DNA transformation protein
MTASAEFIALLREHLTPLGPVAPRRMFGVTGLFCHGLMFAMVSNDTLYFRADDQTADLFQEAANEPKFSYIKQGKTIQLAYWPAPDRLLDDPQDLLAWSRAALGAAARVARTKPDKQPALST